MKDIWNYLKNAQKPIVLYGTGDGADKIISVCDKKGIKVSGVFASDLFVRKREFCGMPVTSFDGARSAFGDIGKVPRGKVIIVLKENCYFQGCVQECLPCRIVGLLEVFRLVGAPL